MIQKAKRTLAMLMAAVMLCGLLPVSAMATTTEQDPVDATTTPVVTEQPEATEQPAATETPAPSETVLPTEQPEETLPDEDTPTAGLPEEVVEPYALTYEELLANTMEEDQPFASGTLGSNNFRIPALVTLSDGTLVAAADARWNHTQDGQNTDTMVAVSDDNGQSWKVSLVNYFADTEDTQQSGAASFIDPALVAVGDTVYLLVDVLPGGVDDLNDCKEGTGYNEDGYLKLSNNNGSSYDYYVGDFGADGYAPVMSSTGATEYAVDERYDLYTVSNGKYTAVSYRETGDDGAYIAANVFYENAEFTVFPTSYLWLVKSENGGETWSAPQILNADVKDSSETFYGVGPGRGLVASDGTIYFSCYQHGGVDITWGSNVEKSSLIYSKDGGKTWKRTNDLDDAGGGWRSYWSSENQAVQLNDGTIRMFYRNGRGVMCYVDLNDNGSWGSPVSLESTMASIGNQYICSSCQLSVIHYSETIDGKEAILVSCPSAGSKGSTGERENGKIFVFTVNEDNSLTAAYSYQVNTGAFQYSCLTELSDGSIGILYENGAASIVYENIAIETIAPDAVIGNGEEESTSVTDTNDIPLDGTSVNLAENGEAKTISVKLSDGQTLSANSSNTNVVTASVTNNQVTLTPVGAGSTTVTLTVSSMSRAAGGTATATLNVTVTPASITGMGTVDLTVGKTTDRTISNADLSEASISYDPNGIASVTVDTESGTTPAGTYAVLGSTTASITSGNKYVIASGNSVLATSGTNLSSASMPSADTALDASVLWTIDGTSSSGYTISQKINGTTYYLGYKRYKRSGSSSWGSTYYSYELALTTTSVPWQWNGSNFSNYLMTVDRPLISDKYESFYLTYSSGWQMTTSSSSLTLYTTEEKEIPGEEYTNSILTFTGVSEGTTTVTIGNYQYTVNVSEKPPFDEDAYTIISNDGTENYSKGQEVEYLILAKGSSYDLDVENASDVTWSSAASNIASVDYSGTITANAVGEATITAHISDGDNEGDKTVYVTVVDNGSSTGWYSRKIEFYVADVQNTNLYYVENGHTGTFDFQQVQEHTVIYGTVYGKWNMVFFAAPHDGYALTYLSAANNYGNTDWTSIKNNELVDPNNTAFKDAYGQYYYKQVLSQAQGTYGADGCFWFTRANTNDGTGDCQAYIIAISEKLPTVEKKIVSVDNEPYEPGMSAQKGDQVKFEITVTCYPSTYGISYSNVKLTDSLSADGSSDWTEKDISLSTDGTQTFEYIYTVVDGDIGNTIRNTVNLSYDYSAKYSEGSYNVSDTASAELTALPFTPKDYVVDFGLSVQFDMSLSDEGEQITYNFKSAVSAQDMDIQLCANSNDYMRIIQYTPNKAFTGVDTVTVTNENGSTFSFHVYPATTVYYDANFVNGVTVTEPVMEFYQTASAVGSKDHYGYEAGYNNAGYSNSASGTLTSEATFTFTGTGVDIYANPTNDSCYVAVRIYKGEELVHLYVVDTAMVAGTNATYTSVPSNAYNVPIVSELGLEYGTYTVEIERVDPDRYNSGASAKRTDVTLNGFRVYGTLANGDTTYTKDGEASPTFTQLRDVLINTLWSKYKPSADLNQQYDQVYADPKSKDMTASIGDNLTADDAQDLLINGPKNEIYLTNGQTLTITVPAGDYQIGLKALDEEKGTVEINGTGKNVTNVDMFYKVNGTKITIKNTGDAMIAVTYLKKTVR